MVFRRAIMLAAATGALAFGAVAVGCGDDDDDSDSAAETTETTADASEVTVTADEYSFDLSATPSAETETIVLDNVGEEAHAMIFARINEGFTTEEALELQGEEGSAEVVAQTDAGPGQQKTTKVRGPVEPGEYAMLCPIEGKDGPHYELGQLEEFSIE